MARTILISLALICLAGCAGFHTFLAATGNPVFQRTVQYATIKFLAGDQEKATEAERIVKGIQRHVHQEAEITIYELETLAIESIPWDKLDKADQFVLIEMISDISAMLRERVGDGQLKEEDKVRVNDFLAWILQAIQFAQR